jgi:hypothetical protein
MWKIVGSKGIRRQKLAVFNSLRIHGCYLRNFRSRQRARKAITKAFGEDLLESHRVMKRNRGIIEDADLILVMDQKLRAGLPPRKTQLLSQFFGFEGDIGNPWPDYTSGADQRYRKCLAQLRSLIEPNADRLITELESGGSTPTLRLFAR